MKSSGNTILITGGATGIGFAMAQALAKQGNKVIICGRREQKLEETAKKIPGLQYKSFDLSKESQRKELFDWSTKEFPNINILVNNAGIQRRIDFKKGINEFLRGEDEIEINFKAYASLCAYFIPFLMKKKEAAIINVSSGLGFVPIAFMPVYCATKAAIHSFSISLRHQLKDTSIKVFEIIPPTVDTELDHGQRPPSVRGISASIIGEAAANALKNDQFEVPVGMAENLVNGSKENFEQAFNNINH
jgi:uncharacterized oxidoreductase